MSIAYTSLHRKEELASGERRMSYGGEERQGNSSDKENLYEDRVVHIVHVCEQELKKRAELGVRGGRRGMIEESVKSRRITEVESCSSPPNTSQFLK